MTWQIVAYWALRTIVPFAIGHAATIVFCRLLLQRRG